MNKLAFFEKLLEAEDYKFKVIKDYIPLTPLSHDPNKDIDDREDFIAYKQFLTLYDPDDKSTFAAKGKLYPLYVNGKKDVKDLEDGKDKNLQVKDCIEVGKWYRCGQGELQQAFNDDGSPYVVSRGKNKGSFKYSVKSKLGNLSYRPGWHCGKYPLTRHIGIDVILDEDGNVLLDENDLPMRADKKYKSEHKDLYANNDHDYMRAQNVWAKVEYSAKNNFSNDESNGENGIFDFRDNEEDKYKDGYYNFKTNTSAAGNKEDWIIADAIKVVKVLSDREVDEILRTANKEEGKHFKNQKRFYADGSEGNKFIADLDQFS